MWQWRWTQAMHADLVVVVVQLYDAACYVPSYLCMHASVHKHSFVGFHAQ